VRTATATSAGGVVIDADGRVLMIARRAASTRLAWTLPKGLVEPGEAPEDAAVREVREETGVGAEVTGPPHTIDYWYVWKPEDTRYHKFVHYYPMQPTSEAPGEPDGEAERVEWVSASDALRRATYANERAVLAALIRAD
jgi:8-oxo-dGTP pyrophosphatase MutT (NUDIX family)